MSTNRNEVSRYLKPKKEAAMNFWQDGSGGGIWFVSFCSFFIGLEVMSAAFFSLFLMLIIPLLLILVYATTFTTLLFTSESFLRYFLQTSRQWPHSEDKYTREHRLKTYYKNIADIDAEMHKIAPEEWAIIGDWHPPDYVEPLEKPKITDPSQIPSSDLGRAQWQLSIQKQIIDKKAEEDFNKVFTKIGYSDVKYPTGVPNSIKDWYMQQSYMDGAAWTRIREDVKIDAKYWLVHQYRAYLKNWFADQYRYTQLPPRLEKSIEPWVHMAEIDIGIIKFPLELTEKDADWIRSTICKNGTLNPR